MTTIHTLLPEEGVFKNANFPQFKRINGTLPITSLMYDASTQQTAYWRFVARDYVSGNFTLTIYWYADTASSASVIWEAQLAAITANVDSQNVETKSLDTLNFVQDTHLGTTGQRVHKTTLTLSNMNSLGDGDLCWLSVARDADGTNGTDDMSGDAAVLLIEVSYD